LFLESIKQRKNLIVPAILLTVAFGLLIFNSISGPGRRVSPLGRAVVEVLSYPQAMVSGTVEGIGEVWHKYFFLRDVERENRQLRQDVESLTFELQQLRERLALVQMNLPDTVWRNARLLPARIIALSAREEFMTVTVNRGSSNGVKYGMAVVTGIGVVGKVIGGGEKRSVPPHSARVMLLTDPRCRVDALIYRLDDESMPDPSCPWNPLNWSQTRVSGVVQGDGKGLILKFVERGSDIKVGDMVVSSGLGGVFAKGLSIGRVSSVEKPKEGLCMNVNVTPSVDFDTIEEVMVMIKEGDPVR